jgi:hypothetical protein
MTLCTLLVWMKGVTKNVCGGFTFDSFPPNRYGLQRANRGVTQSLFRVPFFASRSRLDMTCSEPHFCLRITRGCAEMGMFRAEGIETCTSLGHAIFLKVELKTSI